MQNVAASDNTDGQLALISVFFTSKEHKKTFDETYDRAIDIFVEYGPFEEYENFFNLIEEINEEEPSFIGSHGKKILINFKKKLHRAFMENEDITYDDNEIEEDE